MKKMNDHDRLHHYVERFFAAHAQEEWPTVRHVARAFGWTHRQIEDAIDGDPDGRMFTSSYFVKPDPPFGEHFIETC